jgi:hypothetical protein
MYTSIGRSTPNAQPSISDLSSFGKNLIANIYIFAAASLSLASSRSKYIFVSGRWE